jgi:hypothetical protein
MSNSIIKIAVALLALLQIASAFVPTSSTTTAATRLNAETKVTGIGGLVGGIEIVGVDKLKSKSATTSSKPKAAVKKVGGFKFPVLKKK